MKRALVLSGGGAKGAWQAGVIDRLYRSGGDWDIFAGVSVGALNAAMLAQHSPATAVTNLANLWLDIDTPKVYRHHNRFLKWLMLPWKKSVYSTEPLRKLIAANYNPDFVARNNKTLLTTAVDLQSGAGTVHTNGPASAIYGSAAFPLMFEPQEEHAAFMLDGGLRDVTPLGAAIQAGATDITVVLCEPRKLLYWSPPSGAVPLLSIATRALEIMMNEIVENDLNKAAIVNRLVSQKVFLKDYHREVFVRVIRPKPWLMLGDSLDFSTQRMRDLYASGLNEGSHDTYVL